MQRAESLTSKDANAVFFWHTRALKETGIRVVRALRQSRMRVNVRLMEPGRSVEDVRVMIVLLSRSVLGRMDAFMGHDEAYQRQHLEEVVVDPVQLGTDPKPRHGMARRVQPLSHLTDAAPA